MALTKVSGGILDPGIDVAGIVTATGFDGPFVGGSSKNITAGTVTATELDLNGNGDISGNLVVGGNLTANGDFTTLNTTLREVEILRVDANSSEPAGIITQTGAGDLLRLYDGTSQVVTVDDEGKVGIGTNDLDFPLHVFNSTANNIALFESGDAFATMGLSDSNGSVSFLTTLGSLRIRVNGDAGTIADNSILGMSIKNNGYVGIGTDNPSQELDVRGNAEFTGIVTATGADINGDLDVDGRTELDITNISETLNVTGIGTIGSGGSGYAELQYQGVKKLETTSDTVDVFNRVRCLGGTAPRIQFFGDVNGVDTNTRGTFGLATGANEIVHGTGENDVALNTPHRFFIGHASTEVMAKFDPDGPVQLYHDNVKRFETTGTGVGISSDLSVSGISTLTGQVGFGTHITLPDHAKLKVGTHEDIKIYNKGNLSIIANKVTGDASNNNPFHIHSFYDLHQSSSFSQYFKVGNSSGAEVHSGGDSALTLRSGGPVEAYYDGTKRFSTSGIGATVYGEIATSQDYPTFRPTLDLNFVSSQKLDSRITYTRSGPASFVNKFGKIILVGDNVPRFDYGHEYVNTNSYKLTNSESRGLLIEESRTNLVSYSIYDGDKSGTAQTSSGDTGNWDLTLGHATYTGGIDAPDGSNDAVRFTNLNTGASLLRIPIPSFTPNGSDTYTLSFYVRGISGTGSLQCDLNDGGPMLTDWHNQIVTNEWVRIVVSGTPSNGAKTFVDISNNADNNRVFDIWGVQLEKGAFPTSFIPTHGSTATRGADLVLIDGEEFSEFYNPIESTIVVDYTHHDGVSTSNIGNQPRVYKFAAVGGSDTRIDYVSNTGYNPYIAKDGTAVASIAHGKPTVFGGGVNRTAVRVKEDSFGVSFNGSAVSGDALDTSGAWNPTNTITQVTIGGQPSGSFGNQLSGHIQRFMYYSVGLPDSQLVTLTS